MTPLIEAAGLTKHFPVRVGTLLHRHSIPLRAVDDVALCVLSGETLGLVGESGCGKSTLGRLLIRLIPATSGNIIFDGADITLLNPAELRVKRRAMQIIFQDPYGALNPRMSVEDIVMEPLLIHGARRNAATRAQVTAMLALVGLPARARDRFPHEFSGGQRQRIGIARALVLRPKFVVCDEPVSALDVSVQAQIVNLLQDLQGELGLTYLFIAHDLGVVKHISNRVAVMYLGKIVEMASGDTLYLNPKHPYSGALLSAVPIADPDLAAQRKRIILEGDVPSPIDPPSGCRFHPRCPQTLAMSLAQGLGDQPHPRCTEEEPELTPQHPGQVAACHFPLPDRAVIAVDAG
jgi:oligopeptide/dipeptide ABC transporter ATP-binding protein